MWRYSLMGLYCRKGFDRQRTILNPQCSVGKLKRLKTGRFLYSLFNGCDSKLFPNTDATACTPGHGGVLQLFSIFVEFILHCGIGI